MLVKWLENDFLATKIFFTTAKKWFSIFFPSKYEFFSMGQNFLSRTILILSGTKMVLSWTKMILSRQKDEALEVIFLFRNSAYLPTYSIHLLLSYFFTRQHSGWCGFTLSNFLSILALRLRLSQDSRWKSNTRPWKLD